MTERVPFSALEIRYLLALMGSGDTIIRPGEFTAQDALELETRLKKEMAQIMRSC